MVELKKEGKMSVAGAVVVPVRKELEKELSEKLDALEGVSVEGIGDKGIALLLEAESVGELKKISETIGDWDEVVDFQLAYLNWENAEETQ
jgi:nitrate reductase NapAB chaperone NapD